MKLHFTRTQLVALIAAFVVAIAGCQQARQFFKPADLSGGRSSSPAPIVSSSKKKPSKATKIETALADARSLEHSGELDRAATAYSAIVAEHPNQATAHHRLAVVRERQGKALLARDSFQTALRLDAQNPDLLCDDGYSLYLQGNLKEAEQQLKRALAERPNFPRASNQLGLVMARMGRETEALARFRQAGCSAGESRANVAYALMHDENWTKASKHLELAISQEPNSKLLQTRMQEIQGIIATSPQSSNSLTQGTLTRTNSAVSQLAPFASQVTAASRPAVSEHPAEKEIAPASYDVAPVIIEETGDK